MSNRKAYNQLQTDERHKRSDMLSRFKELNPERYAELLEQAKKEAADPPRYWMEYKHSPTITATIPPEQLAARIEALNNRIYDPKKRHYYIHTTDKWGDEHLFFESLLHNDATEDSALQKLSEKRPRHMPLTIVSLEPCTCPACLDRHGS